MALVACGYSATDKAIPDSVSKTSPNTISDSLKKVECNLLLEEARSIKGGVVRPIKSKPVDFEESLRHLDSLLIPEFKEWIRCMPDGQLGLHHSLGAMLGHEWGLWDHSRLAKSMVGMGVLHPDDMSSIIITSFQRRLKGEDMGLNDQIRRYHAYWRGQGFEVDSLLKQGRGLL